MKFGVLIFPGSNCDHDALLDDPTGCSATGDVPVARIARSGKLRCDHRAGGFAYGDYLRTGAIAKFSPVMESVRKFADGGGIVLGICNGFQILCESGLLPGALMRNVGLKYVCKPVQVRVENADTSFTSTCQPGRGPDDPDRAHGGQLLLRRDHADRLQRTIGSCFDTPRRPAKSRPPPTPTARSTTSPASAAPEKRSGHDASSGEGVGGGTGRH